MADHFVEELQLGSKHREARILQPFVPRVPSVSSCLHFSKISDEYENLDRRFDSKLCHRPLRGSEAACKSENAERPLRSKVTHETFASWNIGCLNQAGSVCAGVGCTS